MVTTNYYRMTDRFERMAEDRDLLGFGSAALVGAGGGVAAATLTDRALGMVDQLPSGNTAKGYATKGTVKLLIGALAGLAAFRVDHEVASGVLAGGGFGAVVAGGLDYWNSLNQTSLPVVGGNSPRRSMSSGRSSRRLNQGGQSSRSRSRRSLPRGSSNGASARRSRSSGNAGSTSASPRSRRKEVEAWG